MAWKFCALVAVPEVVCVDQLVGGGSGGGPGSVSAVTQSYAIYTYSVLFSIYLIRIDTY